MNHCAIQQNTFSACEEMRSSVSIANSRETMVCPKPRRLSFFNNSANEPIRPLRWQMSYQSDLCDSMAGPELLDIILAKGGCGYGSEQSYAHVASSPPFFSGSPPSRVSNPLIQDARFGDEKIINSISPRAILNPSGTSSSSSSSSSARKGGFVRASFGNNPAVKVEGFDCLDRDNRGNCSIPALA